MTAGSHVLRWQGVDAQSRQVGSGVYFVRGSVGKNAEVFLAVSATTLRGLLALLYDACLKLMLVRVKAHSIENVYFTITCSNEILLELNLLTLFGGSDERLPELSKR